MTCAWVKRPRISSCFCSVCAQPCLQPCLHRNARLCAMRASHFMVAQPSAPKKSRLPPQAPAHPLFYRAGHTCTHKEQPPPINVHAADWHTGACRPSCHSRPPSFIQALEGEGEEVEQLDLSPSHACGAEESLRGMMGKATMGQGHNGEGSEEGASPPWPGKSTSALLLLQRPSCPPPTPRT